ncbi:MAG TPA: prepilin-type N-terminal cleavage/methylation domain-containing protein [Actinomycetota bacterium]
MMFDRIRGGARSDEGFTLIELLVVVMIIGVLVGIAIPSYLGFRSSAQNRSAQSEIRTVLLAEEAYILQHGAYTELAADLLLFDPHAAVDEFDSSVGVEPWLNQEDDTIVCLTRGSRSGAVFSVWQSATLGSYFGSTDLSGGAACPDDPPAEYSRDGW